MYVTCGQLSGFYMNDIAAFDMKTCKFLSLLCKCLRFCCCLQVLCAFGYLALVHANRRADKKYNWLICSLYRSSLFHPRSDPPSLLLLHVHSFLVTIVNSERQEPCMDYDRAKVIHASRTCWSLRGFLRWKGLHVSSLFISCRHFFCRYDCTSRNRLF